MKDAAAAPLVDTTSAPLAGVFASPPVDDGWTDVTASSLPRDHPRWQRDAILVSARVRSLIAAMRPVVIRVRTFWDHAVRSVAIGARRLEVDPSGSYRLR